MLMPLALAAGLCVAGAGPAATRAAAPFGIYEVEAGPGGRELTVEARFQPGAGESLGLQDGMGAFVEGAQLWTGGAWRDAVVSGDAIQAPAAREARIAPSASSRSVVFRTSSSRAAGSACSRTRPAGARCPA